MQLRIRYGFRNYYFSMVEHLASKSRGFIIANFTSKGPRHVPIFDASVNPYDIKTVSISDFRERGPLYKFRRERLSSYLDEYARKKTGVYLVGALFFYGIERIHILARMVRVAPSRPEAETYPFQITSALIHYE